MTDRRSKGPAYWQNHIDSWSQSGLTQAEYCRLNNLSKSGFYNWKSKLKGKPSFIPVEISKRRESTNDTIKLVLPNGMTIRCPMDADPAGILPWLEQLNSL